MGRGVQVPITPSVLDWAIRESGLGFETVARRVDVAEADLRAWLSGKAQPSLSAFHKLAAVLHWPTATFLLPGPPRTEHVAIEFRHPRGSLIGSFSPRSGWTFLRAVQRDVITVADAMRYLDLGDQNLSELEKLAA